MTSFLATLEDETRDLPKQQIAWDTFWKLCWDAIPGAVRYEMQIVTSEGTSPRLRELNETCWKIQVATGRNPKKEGLRQRNVQLKLQYGQLAVRLRAVLADGRTTPWSRSFAVAESGVAAGAPADPEEHAGHRH